jgi:hypothetical protein
MAEIEVMGFDYSSKGGWSKIKLALLTYKRLYNDLHVRHNFVVPEDDSNWPKVLWGMNLGQTLSRIRCSNSYNDYREELEAMGFDYSSEGSWDRLSSALQTYKKLHCDLLVPTYFVGPENISAWPEKLWGMKLGQTMIQIRSEGDYSDHREDLDAMGVNVSNRKYEYSWGQIKLALRAYKKHKGNLLVPLSFVVPEGDITWPGELLGMTLGHTVNIRRGKIYSEHIVELEAMCFEFNLVKQLYGWDKVKLASQTYQERKGDLLVPNPFIVPNNDTAWPQEL